MKNKREGFADSVISLIFSQGIIKIFGLIYSVYLINKDGFGDKGNAIYMGGYQIYVLLLTISSIGVPNAVAKLVAEKTASKDYRGAEKIFKIAFLCFGIIGFLGTIILFFSAKKISSDFILIPECEYSLMVLSPAIFFVSISSVIRGYFNGVSQISKTAKSQTIEQIFKSLLTILFVQFISIYNKNTMVMASVANFASTCAIIISFVYMLVNYIILKRNQRLQELKFNHVKKMYTNKSILKEIFMVSIPITFSAILGSLNKNVDSLTVVRILTPILGETTAKLKYGILSSKIDMLTIMPLSLNIAFATALVPSVASAMAKKDFDCINKKLYFSLQITSIISFPCAMGLSLYSEQILNLLFPRASSGMELLKISAFCIIFMMYIQTIGGVLNGIGKTNANVFVMLVGVVTKLVFNIILIPINNIYEKGAVIANLFSSIISFILMWNILKIHISLKFNLYYLIKKPLISSIIMSLSSYAIYKWLIILGMGEKIVIIVTIIFAFFIYIFMILFLKVFKKEEIFYLLASNKIYNSIKNTEKIFKKQK